jgi:hypothetical protein
MFLVPGYEKHTASGFSAEFILRNSKNEEGVVSFLMSSFIYLSLIIIENSSLF